MGSAVLDHSWERLRIFEAEQPQGSAQKSCHLRGPYRGGFESLTSRNQTVEQSRSSSRLSLRQSTRECWASGSDCTEADVEQVEVCNNPARARPTMVALRWCALCQKLPQHTGASSPGRCRPVTTNVILSEVHRTWNRPEAGEIGKLYAHMSPKLRCRRRELRQGSRRREAV